MGNKYSIKQTLISWYVVILLLVLILFSAILFWYMKDQLYQEVERFMEIELKQLTGEINSINFKNVGDIKKEKIKDILHTFNNRYNIFAIYDSSGKQYMQLKHNILPAKVRKTSFSKIINDWALMNKPLMKNGEIEGYILFARSLKTEKMILNKLLFIILLSIPFTLVIASGGGYLLVKKALLPVKSITETAQEISHNNLSRRIKSEDQNELSDLIATLNQLFERLESSFERQKQFTIDASHELRTPVSVIKAQVEDALDGKQSIPGYRRALQVIKKQVEHMEHLIKQLLILVRNNRNKEVMEFEKFDLVELIEVVVAEMSKMAEKNSISIEKQIKKSRLKVRADQSKITQLLLNLLDNALEYTSEGGAVKIRAEKYEKNAKITVNDNGPGIPSEHLSNIFDRFYRVDKSRSRSKGNTGLGLAICRSIVENHEGKIDVESELGEGTTFTVILPIIATEGGK